MLIFRAFSTNKKRAVRFYRHKCTTFVSAIIAQNTNNLSFPSDTINNGRARQREKEITSRTPDKIILCFNLISHQTSPGGFTLTQCHWRFRFPISLTNKTALIAAGHKHRCAFECFSNHNQTHSQRTTRLVLSLNLFSETIESLWLGSSVWWVKFSAPTTTRRSNGKKRVDWNDQ